MRTPFVYVVTNPALRSVKVGHSTEQSDRLEMLGRAGWQRYSKLYVATVKIAYRVEQDALFQIRHRYHAPQHLPAGSIPVGGWTETVSAELVSPAVAWDVVCMQAALVQLASDQPRRRVTNRVPVQRPIREADLAAVRKLAEDLGGADRLSTRLIRAAVGCRTELALRLRDAVRLAGEQK